MSKNGHFDSHLRTFFLQQNSWIELRQQTPLHLLWNMSKKGRTKIVRAFLSELRNEGFVVIHNKDKLCFTTTQPKRKTSLGSRRTQAACTAVTIPPVHLRLCTFYRRSPVVDSDYPQILLVMYLQSSPAPPHRAVLQSSLSKANPIRSLREIMADHSKRKGEKTKHFGKV